MEIGKGSILLNDIINKDDGEIPQPAVKKELEDAKSPVVDNTADNGDNDPTCNNNNNNHNSNTNEEDLKMQESFAKIKTHFPPAKIKKIMQTDEDIGKVSQATPVIAGRALEFFMTMLVQKSSQQARELNTKKITADILKQTIMTDEKFDFLRENFGENDESMEGDADLDNND